MNKTIYIDNLIELDQITESDIFDLVDQIGDEEIAKNVLMVPIPYKLSDAHFWIEHVHKRIQELGSHNDWCIRYNGQLIGGISLHYPNDVEDPNNTEVGYWLGKAYWGHGIMTKTLNRFVATVFEETSIELLKAPVFSSNLASQRVLQKCGFKRIKEMPRAYEKDGKYIDAILFVRNRDRG